jgi:glycogen debranching enzyme
VFHADGRLAEGAIALCEVQGYVYAAKRGAARLAGVVGERERSKTLLGESRALRAKFEGTFWCDDLGTYALALDGDKRPCRVRTSNAGHCLYTGIASPTRARLVASTLGHPDMFSGWGVRTVASDERRYNPMSYHNGSVWPHDNAIVAAGLARYHQGQAAERILQGMFDTCQALDLQRLPELVCGFGRMPGAGPTLYPVACAPQAWAAGAVYMLLEACLGVTIDGPEQRIRFTYPRLPGVLETVWISNLRVGHGLVDLELRRHGEDVGVNVLRRDGAVEVILVK